MAAAHTHPRRWLLPPPLASVAHLHTHACTQHTPRPVEQVPAMRGHHEPRAEAPLATAMGAPCPHPGHGTNPLGECPNRHLEHLSHPPCARRSATPPVRAAWRVTRARADMLVAAGAVRTNTTAHTLLWPRSVTRRPRDPTTELAMPQNTPCACF